MGDEFPKFKAAAVQAAPVFLDREATVEKGCRLIEEAAGNGAQLIVFPETWIPTYPYWRQEPDITLSEVFLQLFKNSVEIPSPATESLCQAARRAGAYVVMGLNERDPEYKGSLYNTLLFIDREGHIMGRHRKLVPTLLERMVWGRGDGSDLRVFDTDIGRLGGLICFEHHMPLSKYALFAKGEQVHAAVWPAQTFINRVIDAACRQYAYEGQTFVIVACGYITKDMVPDSFPFKERTSWAVNGGSAIISPLGEYLAGPVYDEETILYADIDLDMVVRAKRWVDVVGHYARPDVATLLLNEERQEPMRSLGGEDATYRQLLQEIKALRAKVGLIPYQELKAALQDLSQAIEEVRPKIEQAP